MMPTDNFKVVQHNQFDDAYDNSCRLQENSERRIVGNIWKRMLEPIWVYFWCASYVENIVGLKFRIFYL